MFNPNLESFVIAINMCSEARDLEVIRSFYTGDIAILGGRYKGVNERSYQITKNETDTKAMYITLRTLQQESLLYLSGGRVTCSRLHCFGEYYLSPLCGTFQKLKEPQGVQNFTYCPETHTHWGIVYDYC